MERGGRLAPDDASGQSLMAAALGRIGEYDEALALYGALTQRFPQHAKLWMSFGHVLKTVGQQDEGIAAPVSPPPPRRS